MNNKTKFIIDGVGLLVICNICLIAGQALTDYNARAGQSPRDSVGDSNPTEIPNAPLVL